MVWLRVVLQEHSSLAETLVSSRRIDELETRIQAFLGESENLSTQPRKVRRPPSKDEIERELMDALLADVDSSDDEPDEEQRVEEHSPIAGEVMDVDVDVSADSSGSCNSTSSMHALTIHEFAPIAQSCCL